jgi:hypothetical protein
MTSEELAALRYENARKLDELRAEINGPSDYDTRSGLDRWRDNLKRLRANSQRHEEVQHVQQHTDVVSNRMMTSSRSKDDDSGIVTRGLNYYRREERDGPPLNAPSEARSIEDTVEAFFVKHVAPEIRDAVAEALGLLRIELRDEMKAEIAALRSEFEELKNKSASQ